MASKTWIAMFSQTGTEIAEIMQMTGKRPNIVLTTNTDVSKWNPYLRDNCIVIAGKHNELMDFLLKLTVQEVVITLHGYLRILNPDVCNRFRIYNGHPAPIHIYPELKGKDKQEDQYIFRDKYQKIGVVIHKVVPELDSGEIVFSLTAENMLTSIDDAYDTLKDMSLVSWVNYLEEIVY